jgi:hypothetical protein
VAQFTVPKKKMPCRLGWLSFPPKAMLLHLSFLSSSNLLLSCCSRQRLFFSTLSSFWQNIPKSLPFFKQLLSHSSNGSSKPAFISLNGKEESYSDILRESHQLSLELRRKTGANVGTEEQEEEEQLDLREKTIGILCPNDISYLRSLLAIWRVGGIAVPLCSTHPPSEWSYYLHDSRCETVILHPSFETAFHIAIPTHPPSSSSSSLRILSSENLTPPSSSRETKVFYLLPSEFLPAPLLSLSFFSFTNSLSFPSLPLLTSALLVLRHLTF